MFLKKKYQKPPKVGQLIRLTRDGLYNAYSGYEGIVIRSNDSLIIQGSGSCLIMPTWFNVEYEVQIKL